MSEMQVRHVSFNPMWAGLQMILAKMEDDGWALSHIVSVTQYEAVAVFMRAKTSKEEDGSYL